MTGLSIPLTWEICSVHPYLSFHQDLCSNCKYSAHKCCQVKVKVKQNCAQTFVISSQTAITGKNPFFLIHPAWSRSWWRMTIAFVKTYFVKLIQSIPLWFEYPNFSRSVLPGRHDYWLGKRNFHHYSSVCSWEGLSEHCRHAEIVWRWRRPFVEVPKQNIIFL